MAEEKRPGLIGFEKYRRYAVLLPLIAHDGQWELLFEVRADGLRRQPGEICFPGGHVEAGETYAQAALRECCEELMVTKAQVKSLQPLDVFLSPFDLIVFPYMAALCDYRETFSSAEVKEIFRVPVDWFEAHPPAVYKNRIYSEPADDFPFEKIPGGREYRWGSGSYESVFYEWNGYTIWGMTAAILRGALPQIQAWCRQQLREDGF